MEKLYKVVNRCIVVFFMWSVFHLASRFRFDDLWPPLVAILTIIGAFAGLLLSYAGHVDNEAEKHVIVRAARSSIWATVVMALGTGLMAAYYSVFVLVFEYGEDLSTDFVPEHIAGALSAIPVVTMLAAVIWALDAALAFLQHARRMHAKDVSATVTRPPDVANGNQTPKG